MTACSRLPSPDELAAPDEEVIALVRAHDASIQRDGIAPHRVALEETLREVERRHGRNSSAFVQAHAEAAVMIYGSAGAEPSIGFFREWLRASEAVYGHDHRENAFALGDYGRIQLLAAPDRHDPKAMSWLREALEVRRRVLGPGHAETAASEGFVAEELLASCDDSTSCQPGDRRLVEAEQLAGHAHEVYRVEFPAGHHETGQMRDLLGRIRAKNGKSADIRAGARSSKGAGTPTL